MITTIINDPYYNDFEVIVILHSLVSLDRVVRIHAGKCYLDRTERFHNSCCVKIFYAEQSMCIHILNTD